MQYLKGVVFDYSPMYSIVDIFVVSVARSIIFGVFAWQLRSQKGVSKPALFINYALLILTIAVSGVKVSIRFLI